MKGRLIVVSGPSGVGKTVLCNRLLEHFADRMVFSISATSREPRGAEKDGQEYFFYSRRQFEEAIAGNQFAEWAMVHDNYYGTPKSFLNGNLEQGRHVLLNIDVQGALQIRSCYPDAILTFIMPPSMAVLEERLRKRNIDDETTLCRRLANARKEMEARSAYAVTVINDDLERASRELADVLERQITAAS